jgi:hypothetical protein
MLLCEFRHGVGRNKRQSIAPYEEGAMRCASCTLQLQVKHGVIENYRERFLFAG